METIVDKVHSMGYTTIAVIDHEGYAFFMDESDTRWTTGNKSSWTDYVVFGTIGQPSTETPDIVYNYTVQMMDAHPDWKLMWVEMHYPDAVGHKSGWGSADYAQAVRDSDEGIQKIYEELEARGLLNETVVVITTDHGGHGTDHGDPIEYDMRIWGLIHVPDEAIVGEYEFSSPIDLTATISYLMGIPLSEYATGVPLADKVKTKYAVLNLLGTPSEYTTPVKLPNGTVIEADTLIVGNGYYTLLLNLYNDTTYNHGLGAITYSYLVSTPTTGHQFVGYAGGSGTNPTRSDLQNKNLPDRLNTLYTSSTPYYPVSFALLNDPADLTGVGRLITGSEFGSGVTNPTNDLVEKSLTIEEYGGSIVLKYYAKTKNAGFTSSYAMETNITTYIIPQVPFIIHEVEVTNLDSTSISGYYLGVRSIIETLYNGGNYALLNKDGNIVSELIGTSSLSNYDGYYGYASFYSDSDTGHQRIVGGLFFLDFDYGTPRLRLGGNTGNIAITGITLNPQEAFHYVIVQFTGFSKEDTPEIIKLAKTVWSYIENYGADILGEIFVKASPMVTVRYGSDDSYPIHMLTDWGYDPTNMTVRAVVNAPTGNWSIIEIKLPPNANAVENVTCNATEYSWYFDRTRGVLVVKVLHNSPVEVVADFTTKSYTIPITIGDVSGKEWVNKTVLIELNDINFEDWGLLSETGEDIYITDSAGKPLYFHLGVFNVYYKKAFIYVKLPYLSANGYTTIYLHYGNTSHPYKEYNNFTKVFDWFDDFEVWGGWTQYGNGVISQSSEYVYHGNYSLKKDTNGDPNGGYKSLGFTINASFVLEAWIYRPQVTTGASDRIGLIDDNGNGYGIHVNHNSVELKIDKRDSWDASGSEYAAVSLSRDPVQEWYFARLTRYSNGTMIAEVYDKSGTLIARTMYADITYNTFTSIYVLGGYPYYVDFMRVWQPIDPEPIMIFNWTSGYKGEYYVPINITERSGSDLTDYQLRITLNATNFDGWIHFRYHDGSDIYFTDEQGNPLYYWIENFDLSHKTATIWVNVTSIPANSNVTIYMHYGGDNPYSAYNDPEQVFDFFDDFTEDTLGNYTVSGSPSIENGHLKLINKGDTVIFPIQPSNKLAVEERFKITGYWRYALQIVNSNTGNTGLIAIYLVDYPDIFIFNTQVGGSWGTELKGGKYNLNTYYRLALFYDGATLKAVAYNDDYTVNYEFSRSVNLGQIDSIKVLKHPTEGSDSSAIVYIDYILARKYVSPEPTFSIGSEELIEIGIELPSESLYLIHNITYMPNATQFTHDFTAVNNSTAGYILGTPDDYGWAVYANPYDSTENNATLISSINITLPYSEVFVENVTIYAKINGTGNYSKLWVKVLNSTGGLVAELINTSLSTNWTEYVLSINTTLSGHIKLWINATIESSNTTGEELAIKNVKVFVRQEFNPIYEVVWEPSASYFNGSATHTVELGSAEYINSSVITFKLIEYLIYDGVVYPTQPIFMGNETIGTHNYSVYRISPANYSQALKIYALMENRLKTLRTHIRGFDTDTILVGESLTIESPVACNITILELNQTFVNVSSVTIKFSSVGTYTIVANVSRPSEWVLGYGRKTINVKYGAFSVKLIDVDSRLIDYENFVFQLINETDGKVITELIGNKVFSLGGLWASNYTLRVKLKDIVVAIRDFELNITTDSTTLDLVCPMKKLPADYRGFARTIITNYDKEIVNVTNISTKFPYSRMSILLNGTGAFKLYVNYQGDLPTDINITANNVTNLTYYWDGNYLVIEGSLGSLGIINITDLYKVRLEIYDRLGNPMPEWIYAYINNTEFFGSIIEHLLYPETHPIELPEEINGFEFYSYFDGYNETVRNITINNTDVLYKVWYRIPTKIETVKSFQVTASWFERLLKPFVSSDENTTKVYIEGYLRDYYDNGVPNRPLIVNITDVQANLTWSVNATTDPSGYFRTPLLDLIRGRTYEIKIIYNGDSIYVGTLTTTELTPETLPEAPAPITEIIPINYIILGIGALVIVGAIVGIIRAIKHTIEDIRETKRFVRRKR